MDRHAWDSRRERRESADGVTGPRPAAADGGRAEPALDPSSLNVEPHPNVQNPVLTATDIDDVSHVTFVADPFAIRAEGGYDLFFEIKSRDRHPLFGLRSTNPQFDIGHATSEDGREWTYDGVVLPASRAEHTYPYVFRHEGEWLMCPSPAGSTPDEFRIYRADAFPDSWTLIDTALSGEVRIDPTPFKYDGIWYLPYQEAGSYDVALRYSMSLLDGEWHEHPDSPLFTPGGNDIACGGRPIVHGEGVELFFRRGTPGIVEHWGVGELSPDSIALRERQSSPIVSGSGIEGTWNERNMHHVDAGPALTLEERYILVDGQDADRNYRIGVYTVL